MSSWRFPYVLFWGGRWVYLELKPLLVSYCFFVSILVFFGVRLVDCLHFRRIVVVCRGRIWGIPSHGVVYVHSWIFYVLIHSCNLFSSSVFVTLVISSWFYCIFTPGVSCLLSHYSTPVRYLASFSFSSSGVSPFGMGFPRRSNKSRAGFSLSASASAWTQSGSKVRHLMWGHVWRLGNQ